MLTKCSCQICSGHLEFEVSDSGRTITCPHCGVDTTLYVQNVPKPIVRVVLKQKVPVNARKKTVLAIVSFGLLALILVSGLWFYLSHQAKMQLALQREVTDTINRAKADQEAASLKAKEDVIRQQQVEQAKKEEALQREKDAADKYKTLLKAKVKTNWENNLAASRQAEAEAMENMLKIMSDPKSYRKVYVDKRMWFDDSSLFNRIYSNIGNTIVVTDNLPIPSSISFSDMVGNESVSSTVEVATPVKLTSDKWSRSVSIINTEINRLISNWLKSEMTTKSFGEPYQFGYSPSCKTWVSRLRWKEPNLDRPENEHNNVSVFRLCDLKAGTGKRFYNVETKSWHIVFAGKTSEKKTVVCEFLTAGRTLQEVHTSKPRSTKYDQRFVDVINGIDIEIPTIQIPTFDSSLRADIDKIMVLISKLISDYQ